MEKLSDADLIAAVRICCGPVEYTSCDECPAHEWCSETHKDIMCELEDRLSDLRSCLEDAKNGRLEMARKYQTLKNERDDLRKDVEVLTENLNGAQQIVDRLGKSLRVVWLQRKQAWDKLARITGEREAAWLSEEEPDGNN